MAINAVQNLRVATCPHGLPVGACPICNGMGGGGKRIEQKSNTENLNKDWSWMKCYVQGQMMKAHEAQKAATQAAIQQISFAQQIGHNINNFIGQMQNVLNNIQNNLPQPLQPVFAKIVNTVINPLLNLVAKLPAVFEKIEQFIKNVRAEIMNVAEKLTAILGEIKNFVKDKLQKNFKKITKKLLALFIWDADEENYRDDEELRIFKSKELKKIKQAVLKLTKKGEEDVQYSAD